jgi:hypothetical protein
MESDPSKRDKPDLQHFYENVDETFSFLPDETNKKFIASTMMQSVATGEIGWLSSSPRAKKLKTIVEMSHHALESDRNSLVSEAVTTYVRQKRSENTLTTYLYCWRMRFINVQRFRTFY